MRYARFAAAVLCLSPVCAGATTFPPTVMVGAHANPDDLCTSISAVSACEADLAALESSLGYELGIDSQYSQFDEFSTTTGLPIASDDVAAGRTPMITWFPHYLGGGCPSYDDIPAGMYDTQLTDQAHALAAVGAPILIRFAPAMDAPNHGCGYTSDDPTIAGPEFVAAWQHLVPLVRAIASNAQFIWSPGNHAFSDNQGNPQTTWEYFYPGADYVQWVGGQVYNQGTTKLSLVDDVPFNTWYAQISALGKPVIFSETGAIGPNPQDPCTDSTPSTPSPQDLWIYSMKHNFANSYPAILGIVWFDHAGSNDIKCANYILRGDGFTQFQDLLSRAYFQKKTP